MAIRNSRVSDVVVASAKRHRQRLIRGATRGDTALAAGHRAQRIWKAVRLRGTVFPKGLRIAIPSALLAGTVRFLMDQEVLDISEESQTAPLKEVAAWSGFSFLVGFLIVFRTSQSYARFVDGCASVYAMRAEWFDACSSLVAFTKHSKKEADKVDAFRNVLVRLFSVLHAVALADVEDTMGCDVEDTEAFTFEMLDVVGLDQRTLQALRFSGHKCELVFQWIQCLIVENIDTGVLSIPPPILSRAFQELANGMVAFHDAARISRIPFPFAYVQTCNCLLAIHWLGTPLVTTCWVFAWYWACLFTFIQVFILWTLNFIALEIENPFGQDENDLDARAMQREMNQHLEMLLSEEAMTTPSLAGEPELPQGKAEQPQTGHTEAPTKLARESTVSSMETSNRRRTSSLMDAWHGLDKDSVLGKHKGSFALPQTPASRHGSAAQLAFSAGSPKGSMDDEDEVWLDGANNGSCRPGALSFGKKPTTVFETGLEGSESGTGAALLSQPGTVEPSQPNGQEDLHVILKEHPKEADLLQEAAATMQNGSVALSLSDNQLNFEQTQKTEELSPGQPCGFVAGSQIGQEHARQQTVAPQCRAGGLAASDSQESEPPTVPSPAALKQSSTEMGGGPAKPDCPLVGQLADKAKDESLRFDGCIPADVSQRGNVLPPLVGQQQLVASQCSAGGLAGSDSQESEPATVPSSSALKQSFAEMGAGLAKPDCPLVGQLADKAKDESLRFDGCIPADASQRGNVLPPLVGQRQLVASQCGAGGLAGSDSQKSEPPTVPSSAALKQSFAEMGAGPAKPDCPLVGQLADKAKDESLRFDGCIPADASQRGNMLPPLGGHLPMPARLFSPSSLL